MDAVKLKRKVIAPYTVAGHPKDWDLTEAGNFRLTHPSNLWTDLTIPFWSMPENTDHPTQKPEKLVAKIMLASSNTGDLVLDISKVSTYFKSLEDSRLEPEFKVELDLLWFYMKTIFIEVVPSQLNPRALLSWLLVKNYTWSILGRVAFASYSLVASIPGGIRNFFTVK